MLPDPEGSPQAKCLLACHEAVEERGVGKDRGRMDSGEVHQTLPMVFCHERS